MFYQIFLSPQVKRCAIITYEHGIYELPQELPKNLRFRILCNVLSLCNYWKGVIAYPPIIPQTLRRAPLESHRRPSFPPSSTDHHKLEYKWHLIGAPLKLIALLAENIHIPFDYYNI